MKLALCINTPEDSSGTNDSDTIPDSPETQRITSDAENIAAVLEEELAELCPSAASYDSAEISLSFVSPEEIRALNRDYRSTDEATDVLSFPMMDEELEGLPVLSLGDIVICPEETARLHPELGLHDALCLMIAHSFLHLLGYDHDTEEKQAAMWELQDRIAGRLVG